MGEIQKSYNAYAGILKREADAAYNAVEELRTGPIAMPKDHEWNAFVENDEHFVDPRTPVREAQNIQYPGRDNELAQEVRAGLLERKSKYLKSMYIFNQRYCLGQFRVCKYFNFQKSLVWFKS